VPNENIIPGGSFDILNALEIYLLTVRNHANTVQLDQDFV
jgi:hypothetical protein